MNKYKYFLSFCFIIVSFYFTDKVMNYIDNKNPIMQNIYASKSDYNELAVNAVIEDNTIIPGISGREKKKKKSFVKMNSFGSFNETFFVYNIIKPDISLEDNKDKIILKGNHQKRMISFIVDHNNEVISYFDISKIKYTELINDGDDILSNKKYINGEINKSKFSDMHVLLNKKKSNSNICLVNFSNQELCLKKEYYLVKYSIDASENILDVLNDINSGDIIYINENVTLDNLKLIIKEINRQDLTIEYLDVMIEE